MTFARPALTRGLVGSLAIFSVKMRGTGNLPLWFDEQLCDLLYRGLDVEESGLPVMKYLRNITNGDVLGAAALVVFPLEIVSWPSIVPVMAIAAVSVLLLGKTRWSMLPRPLAALLSLLVALAAASAAWSLEPLGSLKLAAWLLGTFAAGLVLLAAARGMAQEERKRFANKLVIGFLAGLALLEFMFLTKGSAIDYVRNLDFFVSIFGKHRPVNSLVEFDTATSFVALLVWPAIGIALRRRGALPAIAIYGFGLAIIFQGESTTTKLAYLLAGAVFFAGRAAPKAVAWTIGAALAIGIAAAPLVLRSERLDGVAAALPIFKNKGPSLAHRFAIWQFVTERIDERPLLGWGIDSSRWMPGGHQLREAGGELLPLHPHDAALQLRLDLGLPGVLLGIGLVLFIAGSIARRKRDPTEDGLTLALVATASVLALVSYNLWHIWWLSMLWLTVIFALAAAPARIERGGAGTRRSPNARNGSPRIMTSRRRSPP
jgi:exopolysaccharide production protein ExoQ